MPQPLNICDFKAGHDWKLELTSFLLLPSNLAEFDSVPPPKGYIAKSGRLECSKGYNGFKGDSPS